MSSLLKDQSMSKEEGMWLPIETAPLGEYALFWQASWRHPWVGRYTGYDRMVVLDNCDVAATQMDYHADFWAPLPPPPRDRVTGSLELSRGETEGLDGGHHKSLQEGDRG